MSGMREIQRQVITAMHAKMPAMRVRVDVSTLLPSKAGNITVWTFRKAENKVIVENILKVVHVPREGILQESIPAVVKQVVQKMINENLLEAIPPRMILTDDQVTAMKDNEDPVSWNEYLRMSWTEKRDKGKATQETPEQRVQRVIKVKGDAAETRAKNAIKLAAKDKAKADRIEKSDSLHGKGRRKRAAIAATTISDSELRKREIQRKGDQAKASVRKSQLETVEKEGGMLVKPTQIPGIQPPQSAMRSNPYFL